MSEFNIKLRPQSEKLKPGTRVVGHDFGIEGWPPDKVENLATPGWHNHTLLLWRIK